MRPVILMFVYGTLENVPPIINQGSSLAEAGYTVRVLALRYKSSLPRFKEIVPGFYIHRITLLSRIIFGESDCFQFFRYAEVALRSFFWGMFKRANLLVGHDLITLPYVYLLSVLKRKSCIYYAHEIWSEQARYYPLKSFWRMLDKCFARRVSAIVTADINRSAYYINEFNTKIHPTVVYNCPKFTRPVDSSHLKKMLFDRNIKSHFVVFYHGGIAHTRSIDKLVESLLFTTPDVSLVLVGNISDSFKLWYNDFLEKNNLNNRVIYLGFIEHGKYLFELCSGADLGVVFVKDDCLNNRYSGTASNKLFEYMMMGIPIIATNIDSFKVIVEKENVGLCVNSESPKDIARGIMTIVQNKSLAQEMRANAISLASEKYNWEKEFPKLLKLYEGFIA